MRILSIGFQFGPDYIRPYFAVEGHQARNNPMLH
jgi:hypothetical protein